MPSYGTSFDDMDYENHMRERNAMTMTQQREAMERMREREKAENDRRTAYTKALQRRREATTATTATVRLGQATTDIEISEFIDEGYSVVGMNENSVLMVRTGIKTTIVKLSG